VILVGGNIRFDTSTESSNRLDQRDLAAYKDMMTSDELNRTYDGNRNAQVYSRLLDDPDTVTEKHLNNRSNN
jgi:hypothetical protein